MFFSKYIQSIRPNDRVLEIGPGSSPHPRANEFLEYEFSSADLLAQRGGVPEEPEFHGRKVSRYSGVNFPFAEGQFDYVIASHVLEHVEDPIAFVQEICRVSGGRGYMEFPLPTYEYLYDFDVHQNFVWYDSGLGAIRFMPKRLTDCRSYSSVTSQFRRALEMGWDDLMVANPGFFFCGFEFLNGLSAIPANSFEGYSNPWEVPGQTLSRKVARKVQNILHRVE